MSVERKLMSDTIGMINNLMTNIEDYVHSLESERNALRTLSDAIPKIESEEISIKEIEDELLASSDFQNISNNLQNIILLALDGIRYRIEYLKAK